MAKEEIVCYGLTRSEIKNNRDLIDEWDEDRIDHDQELILMLEEMTGKAGVRGVEASRYIAAATLIILEEYADYNDDIELGRSPDQPRFGSSMDDLGTIMTPTLALHSAIIWDRG